MNKELTCNHFWEATDPDSKGQPIFILNKQMATEPVAHVTCIHCNCRTWMTEGQYIALGASN